MYRKITISNSCTKPIISPIDRDRVIIAGIISAIFKLGDNSEDTIPISRRAGLSFCYACPAKAGGF